jgi:hypothetical protein
MKTESNEHVSTNLNAGIVLHQHPNTPVRVLAGIVHLSLNYDDIIHLLRLWPSGL